MKQNNFSIGKFLLFFFLAYSCMAQTPPAPPLSSLTGDQLNAIITQDNTQIAAVNAELATRGNILGSTGIAGETVFLDLNNTGTLDATYPRVVTGANGTYAFNAMKAGAYIVRQVLPPGYGQITPTKDMGVHLKLTAQKIVAANFINSGAPTTNPTTLPIPPPTTQPFSFGINFGGTVATNSDPDRTLSVMRQFGASNARYWLTSPCNKAIDPNQFKTTQRAAALGIQNCVVINPGSPVAPHDLLIYANSWPTSTQSGVKYVEWVSELTNSVIWHGTVQQYVDGFNVISPILRAKGYLMVEGSVFDPNMVSTLLSMQGFAQNVNGVGGHFYFSDAGHALPNYEKIIQIVRAYNLQHGTNIFVINTEVGLHQGDIDIRAAESTKLWQGARALTIKYPDVPQTYIHFLMYWNNFQGGGPSGLVNDDAKLTPHEPIWSAMKAGLFN